MKETVIRAHEWENPVSQKTEMNNMPMEMSKKLKPFGRDIVGATEVVEGMKKSIEIVGLTMEAADVRQRRGNVQLQEARTFQKNM